ncbi:hypothetical protein ABZ348_02475 [Streptomyces sp. NPDC005963]|uniref:hypothetical protein n=1 Tax=Streptomyces sp. NPDC005963 TaxID=3156721 RepID=UPI0033CE9E47
MAVAGMVLTVLPVTAASASARPGPVQSAVLTPADVTAPPAPTGVQTAVDRRQVKILWNAVAAPDLAGYRLYRAATTPVPRDPAHRIGGLNPIAPTFRNDMPKATGSTYYYVVTAVDRAGNESAASTPAAAVSNDLNPPPAPTGVTATRNAAGVVTLNWDAKQPGDTETVGYRIAMCGSEPTAPCFVELMGPPLTVNTWTSLQPVQVGTRFAVVAVDARNNMSSSPRVTPDN